MTRAASLLQKLRRWGWDLFGVIASVIYALPTFDYPFSMDHPIHWYIGRRLLDGEMPYVSGTSTKPPAVFIVHALSIVFFGDRQSSIRITDLLFALGCGVLIATFRVRARARNDEVVELPARKRGEIGAACVLVVGLHYTFFDFNDAGHPELWQAFFMLASAWVIARAPDGRLTPKAAFLAGALACTGLMFKHTAVISGVVYGFAVVVLGLWRRSLREALSSAALYTAGVAVVLAITILPFMLTGTFDAFWEFMVDFILNHYAPGAGEMRGTIPFLAYNHGLFAAVVPLALLAGGASIAAATRDRRGTRIALWIFVAFLAAFGTVAIQKRAFFTPIFNYYFVVMVPFLALAAGWGLRRTFPRSGTTQLAAALLIVAAFFFYGPTWTHVPSWSYRKEWSSWWAMRRGERTWEEHAAPYVALRPVDSYLREVRAARVIRRHMRAGDTLCVDGFVPIFYTLTGLRCPSRFIAADGVPEGPPSWPQEWAQMWRRTPPTFFVTFSDRPPRLRELEGRGYERHDVTDGQVPYYVVFERRRR